MVYGDDDDGGGDEAIYLTLNVHSDSVFHSRFSLGEDYDLLQSIEIYKYARCFLGPRRSSIFELIWI